MIQAEGLTPYEVAERLGYGPGGWVQHLRLLPRLRHRLRLFRPPRPAGGALHPAAAGHCPGLSAGGRLSASVGELLFPLLLPRGEAAGLSQVEAGEFENFVTTKALYCRQTHFRGNAPSYSFSTINHPELTAMHALCYPGGRKRLSRDWLEGLTPLSLAVWYLDDGSLNRRYGTIVLCTNCFSRRSRNWRRTIFRPAGASRPSWSPGGTASMSSGSTPPSGSGFWGWWRPMSLTVCGINWDKRRLISAPVPGFLWAPPRRGPSIMSGGQTIASRCSVPLHLVVHAGMTLAPCYPSLELQVNEKGFYAGWG